ncbi:MAG: hypothetical protein AB1489_21550 [Acidobacteriota bacterium]
MVLVSYLRRSLLIISVLAINTMLSCYSSPPTWPIERQDCASTLSQSTTVSTDNIVAYIDESASMRGFLYMNWNDETTQQTIYSRTLAKLQDIVTSEANLHFYMRRVSESVGRFESSGSEFDRATHDASFYHKGITNIAKAVQTFTESVPSRQSTNNQIDQEKSVARLHILISDGIESKVAGGVDPSSLKVSLQSLIKQGWAGCVIGVKSQFADAAIIPETNDQLRIAWESGNDVKKFRPFYLFIFSPDHNRLKEFVEALKKRIKEIIATVPNYETDSLLQEYDFTTLYTDPCMPDGTKWNISSTNKRSLLIPEASKTGLKYTLWLDVNTSVESYNLVITKLPLTNNALDGLTQKEIANLLDWKLTPYCPQDIECSRQRYPQVLIDGEPLINSDGTIALKLKADWGIPGKRRDWCFYNLEGVFSREKLAQNDGPNWIHKWSTDQDYIISETTKTYRFPRVVAGLWNNDFIKEKTAASLQFRIGPY